MEKNPGGQKFWQRGGGEISKNSILPPQNACCPSNAPQIPKLGAAMATGYHMERNGEGMVDGRLVFGMLCLSLLKKS